MKNTFKALSIAAIVCGASISSSYAADAIVGMWKRGNGTIVQFSGSNGRYCGTVKNGKYKGKSIGCMKGSGNQYTGSIKVLDEGKTYSGKASVSGNTMKMSGCVLKILCKSENLKRQ